MYFACQAQLNNAYCLCEVCVICGINAAGWSFLLDWQLMMCGDGKKEKELYILEEFKLVLHFTSK